jgi:transmembrane sensor
MVGMHMDQERLNHLLRQWLDAKSDSAEEDELKMALSDPEKEAYIQQTLLDWAGQEPIVLNSPNWQAMAAEVLRTDIPSGYETPPAQVHVIEKGTRRWSTSLLLRWAAAAAILLMGGIGTYQYLQSSKEKPAPIVAKIPVKTDILPGGNKAVLTLADGSTITLQGAANGQLAAQGRTFVVKKADGQIEYHADGSVKAGSETVVAYNTTSTPNGGQYQVSLSDGTKVWLNAASSITYPTSFTQKTRTVDITGEAYFEVAHNAKKPFIVRTMADSITVLGTHFNVNTYQDEPVMRTSLLKGSVRINKTTLKPGQAYVNGKVMVTDTEQDIAWKSGVFNFQHVRLEEAMRQLSRWYNIRFQIKDNLKEVELLGMIERNLTLQQVLKGMQDAEMHFTLEGKILTVSK